MTKIKTISGWLAVGLLCLLGVLIYFCVPGFRFSGLFIIGSAGIAACYLVLNIFRKHHKKAGKVLLWILTAILCVGILAAAVTGIIIHRAAAGANAEACEYVIVLGAGVNGTTPSYILSCRLNAAYDYLQANPDVICIVFGGQGPGEDISEAQCMFENLTARGVAADRIWLEDQSTSTQENLQFSLALIEEKTGTRPEKAGLLSNEFHLYRAGRVAQELELDPVGIPAETAWVGLHINYFIREIFAVWYYSLFH